MRRNQGEHRDEGGGLVKEDRVGWIGRISVAVSVKKRPGQEARGNQQSGEQE